MYKLSLIDKLSFLLVLIGAINWGLIGLLNFNLVRLISLGNCYIERIIYILVFAGAVNLIVVLLRSKTDFKKSC
ncbi:DUF378 domain-containing protein [Clostridium folliculivorans]|uniref:DUF378 domain-containing protein n=1 Tax=Clostridium folliculivorans TaxID=2886038 RepID=A0A9W6DAD7_9CLOT|nr:DUF378 domain-containing protein [Clostridium folliculivorans]GKU24722.1 hypothetical protein CFOLD11_15480 [Clostridium folliculivorans]GKU30820.1 hypothetical protein CFB3_29270 [Clostridium folliculivorans]